MPLTRIRQTAIGADAITTPKLDDTAGGLTLPGTQYVHVPVGTTAQRPSSPANGYLRYNTNFERLEQYADGQWQSIDTPPSITSLSYSSPLTAADPAGGETITLVGSNFQAGATVTVGGTSATSVSVVSSTSITFTTPAKTAGDYDVTVTNSNGLAATLLNGISYNGVPSFTTAAGNVGSIAEDQAMSTITIVAAESDGGTLAYSVTSGALPTGVSMSSAGAITGTPNVNPTSNTTFNFTVTATDDENQTNSRAFNLIVLRPIYATQISNSLRFNDDDTAYLTRTFSSGNQRIFTLSGWIKRSTLGLQRIFSCGSSGTSYVQYRFDTNDNILISSENGGAVMSLATTQKFRDLSAWYHLTLSVDTTQATASNRVKLYVNGEQVTDFSTSNYPAQNTSLLVNSSIAHYLGTLSYATTGDPLDGYMSDVYFVDGQQLAPTSFAEEFNGVWTPKAYSGTYGTNGFKLDFSDSSDLGKDSSQDYTLVTGGSTTYGGGTTNYTSEANAFDGDVATSVDRASSNGIIEITPASSVTPVFHSITTVASAAYTSASRPNNVQLEGSNDGGSTWTVIDTISNTTNAHSTETTSSFSNSTSYAKLRLNITSNNGGSNTRFSEYKVISSEAGGGLSINNFTTNGMASSDSVIDSPTNNWAVWAPLSADSSAQFKEGNLEAAAADNRSVKATFSMPTGKWYWENRMVSGQPFVGICPETMSDSISPNSSSYQTIQYYFDGRVFINSVSQGNIGSYTTGDIIGATFDASIHQLTFYKNNTQVGQYTAPDTSLIYSPFLSAGSTNAFVQTNFGQDSTFAGNETAGGNADGNGLGDFAYSPPSGFLALCSKNLSESAIDTSTDDRPEDYFNTVLWTGNGSSQSITNVGFQPDFVWLKQRNGTQTHQLLDTVRGKIGGANSFARLRSDTTAIQATPGSDGGIQSMDSNGFTLGSDAAYNGNTNTYVGWCWKAGGAPTASNVETSGAMTANSVSLNGTLQSAYTPSGSPTVYPSKMSINTKSGFSIISYTEPSGSFSIPHGLSETPDAFFFKATGGAENWIYWSNAFPTTTTNGLYLNDTSAQFTTGANWLTGVDNNKITITSGQISGANDKIIYVFNSVAGFSKFGSYTGNGSANGQFINLGFKPAFWMMKAIPDATHWVIYDAARETYNEVEQQILPNETNAEGSGGRPVDFTSNGVKLRFNSYLNDSGQSYVYMAFAEDPFKYAEAR